MRYRINVLSRKRYAKNNSKFVVWGMPKEAVDFYLSVFPRWENYQYLILSHRRGYWTSKEFAGKVLAINFELLGEEFVAINAGPEFTYRTHLHLTLSAKIKLRLIITGMHLLLMAVLKVLYHSYQD